MNTLDMLLAQGIPQKMAERIIAQATAEKKEKKPRKYFPGMSSTKKKQPLDIDVLVICECCGASETVIKTIEAYPDSPTTQKVGVSLCNKCPDYFRALTHEQLVSLALIRHHRAIVEMYPMDKSQVKFAKKHTPEEIVHLDIKHH